MLKMIEKKGRKSKKNPFPYVLKCDGPDCHNKKEFEDFEDAKNYNKIKDGRIKWITRAINGHNFQNYCPECAQKLDIKPFVIECINCHKIIEFRTWAKMIEYKEAHEWGNKKVEINNQIKWIYCCQNCKHLLKLKKGIRWKTKNYDT
jgi:hypothetical protein